MSSTLLKTLLYGQDFVLRTPADVIYLYEEWKTSIKAESFNPLALVFGGISILSGHSEDDRSLQAILFGQDWLHKCKEIGVSPKNALICLASNFDDQMGMAAMALELGMIISKPKTDPSIHIDSKTFAAIIGEIFMKDYAGVRTMAEKWNVTLKEGFEIEPKKTRSDWRKELGHDVLIHPATLKPCTDSDGSVLEYQGITRDKTGDKGLFKFIRRATNEEFTSDVFLPISTS